MARAVAVPLTLLLTVILVLLVLAYASVFDLPLCSDSGRDPQEDCIEGGGFDRALGLVLGALAVVSAGAGVWFGVRLMRRGTDGRKLAMAAVATPLLALAALLLLPVSF